MKISKKDFNNISIFLDNIEKVDFTRLNLDELFDNIPQSVKHQIRNDYKGIENIKILRLLYQLDSVRSRYNITLKQ